jgi:hypothetical protein
LDSKAFCIPQISTVFDETGLFQQPLAISLIVFREKFVLDMQGGFLEHELARKPAFIELNLDAVTVCQPKDIAASDLGVSESETCRRPGAATKQPAQFSQTHTTHGPKSNSSVPSSVVATI